MCKRVLQEWDEFKDLMKQVEGDDTSHEILQMIVQSTSFQDMKCSMLACIQDPEEDSAMFES